MPVRLILALVLGCISAPVAADELRPAYIELEERAAGAWTLVWKASARSALGVDGRAQIPANCRTTGLRERWTARSNVVTRHHLACAGGLAGQRIGLQGLADSKTDALVRIMARDGSFQTLRLTPAQPVAQIPLTRPVGNIGAAYFGLGVEHILLGFDHLLFVIGLVLLIGAGPGGTARTQLGRIVATITAFTLAHSLTLVGTTLGWLTLPQRPVEAVIALSIVFLAAEIVKSGRRARAHPRLSERLPWLVALLFGLLHGFGFAGALAEIGLPRGDVPLALLTFNIGVEAGQLLIVMAALALVALVRHFAAARLAALRQVTAYAMGMVAALWLIERMAV